MWIVPFRSDSLTTKARKHEEPKAGGRGGSFSQRLVFFVAFVMCPLWGWGQAPSILLQPSSQSVASGSNVVFSVGVSGGTPFSYQWRLFETNLVRATNSSLVITNVRPAAGGLYSVVVTNFSGAVTSEVAVLSVDEHLTFRIVELQTNGALTIEHFAESGDDRNGLVVSAESVFVTGDNSTARAAAGDLSGVSSLGVLYDALVSNLRTERIYSLANGGNLLTSFGGLVNSLVEMDPVT